MAKVEGITKYVCDRCGRVDFLEDKAPQVSEWRTIKRVNADAAEISRLLCSSCYSKYRELVDNHDRSFNDYMTNHR